MRNDENATKVMNLKSPELMPSTEKQRTITPVGFFMVCVGMYVQLVSFTTVHPCTLHCLP